MRSTPLLSLILVCLLLACNGKDSITLTEDNYVYEGELYHLYLSGELEAVNTTIGELEAIIANNQGDEQTEIALQQALENKASLSNELAGIPDIAGFDIVPPRPPCPNGDLCLPSDFKYLLTDSNINIGSFTILDAQQNPVVMTTNAETKPLEGSNGQLQYISFEVEEGTGPVSIEVSRQEDQGDNITYTVSAFKQ
ncbi:MAG: hypothetical protein AB3N14_07270 [Flavobacteriaceae bacterium]